MNTSPTDNSSRLLFHLRAVGKIALVVAGLSALILVGVVLYVSPSGGGDYFTIVRSLQWSRESLDLAMLVGGFILVSLTGVLTWMISLYSSFRIAGPLFRFTRNIEAAMSHDAPVLPIRKEDRLQRESDKLIRCIGEVRGHCDEMTGLVEKAVEELSASDRSERANARDTLIRLKELGQHVRLAD